jgi:hypothetical protein
MASGQLGHLGAVRRRGQLADAGDDVGEPGGELEAGLDHVHLDLALRADLAVLARQQLDPLVVVGGERPEARLHLRGAVVRVERGPGREGSVRRGDGGARLLVGGRRRVADHHLRVGGIVDGEALGPIAAFAADEQAGADLGSRQRLGHVSPPGRVAATERRGRDSNPRTRLTPVTRFPVVPVQPLRHLSWKRVRG